MLTVACVKWGSRYKAEYVNILADAVFRNLPVGFPVRFVCFTDNPDGIDSSIICRPLPPDLIGWWNKLYLFSADAFSPGERVLYFDLDTVIASDLDEIVYYAGKFGILSDPYHPQHYNSSCMMWTAGDFQEVWTDWIEQNKPELPLGDQQWIESKIKGADFFQKLYPGSFQSYKAHCYPFPPMGTKVVYFHGEPKPHNCGCAWIERLWKIGGESSYELKLLPNAPVEAILNNVRENAKRDLEWICGEEAHEGVAVIVGSGPSLLDTIDDIRARERSGQTVFALNGAGRVLLENGIEPDFQIVLDSRPQNVEFLLHSQQCPGIHHLLASQVDPLLVESHLNYPHKGILGSAALFGGCGLTIWHPGIEGIDEILSPFGRDYALIGGGTTVGLCALCLVYTMGYRNFHLFGYDSSYRDGQLHAVEQFKNGDEYPVNVVVNGGSFMASAAMAQQARRFPALAIELAERGCVIAVHGDGLLPTIAHELAAMPSYTMADIRAAEILERVKPEQPVIGAEIGVYQGTLSSRLLRNPNITLHMVDLWREVEPDSTYALSGDDLVPLPQNQWDDIYQRVLALTEFAGDRANIIRADSVKAASTIEDGSLDFVFIDADHSYEGCRRDLEAWYPKVKDGGLFSGHDYDHPEFPNWGVKRAVDEFALTHGIKVELGANFTWFATKPSACEMAA